MKQVVTTADFATLDENTKNCENGANYVDCVSQKYMRAIIEQCNCLPYRLQNYSAAIKVLFREGFIRNKWGGMLTHLFFNEPFPYCKENNSFNNHSFNP